VRALILANLDVLSAGLVWGWLRGGNGVVALYGNARGRHQASRKDDMAGLVHNSLSLQAAARAADCDLSFIGTTQDWQDVADTVARHKPDVILSIMFMHRIPGAFLKTCKCPVLNLHPALLPDYRGSTPVASMMLDGEEDTFSGLTLHVVEDAFDTGPIISQKAVPVSTSLNPAHYIFALIQQGSRMLTEDVSEFVTGNLAARQQPVRDDLRTCHPAKALSISNTDTGTSARRKLERLSFLQPVRAADSFSKSFVKLPLLRIDRDTGQPLRVGFWTIDMDLADGRYRIRRVYRLAARHQQAKFLRRLARLHAQENAPHGF
jgi:methionyl-tRNA formyltransferase